MDQRVDVINASIEELIFRRYELPAFSTLDRIAEAAAVTAQERLYESISAGLTSERREFLDSLLSTDFAQRQSAFQAIKIGKHTSELQSLMRISYAVFCLKKKKT